MEEEQILIIDSIIAEEEEVLEEEDESLGCAETLGVQLASQGSLKSDGYLSRGHDAKFKFSGLNLMREETEQQERVKA